MYCNFSLTGPGGYEDEGSGGYVNEDYEMNNGLEELNNQIIVSTGLPGLQTTENIQPKQGIIPRRQSNCQDKKIWCMLADCSLGNVKRNCQKTCNLC